jgi:hypothetical protein
MADPAALILEEETETDRLRMALADTLSDLQRRDAALLKLQGELMASRLEVARARRETVQFQGLLRRAEEAGAAQATAHARAGLESATASWNAEITQLHAVIATLQAETSALRTGMDLLRASASWRISAPIRVVGRWMRGVRRVARGVPRAIRRPLLPRTAPLPQSLEALPNPADPNQGAILQTGPFVEHPTDATEGVVTLNALYQLSRSL